MLIYEKRLDLCTLLSETINRDEEAYSLTHTWDSLLQRPPPDGAEVVILTDLSNWQRLGSFYKNHVTTPDSPLMKTEVLLLKLSTLSLSLSLSLHHCLIVTQRHLDVGLALLTFGCSSVPSGHSARDSTRRTLSSGHPI
ncbi:hypothetical protein WMY93_010505 [Mugilogobius chulae]|uniref:Uncharacterized protein n=1 Tax=Mugilogobius chulae TaxID=88201 RepID=A0AAW0PAU1_9GOBI